MTCVSCGSPRVYPSRLRNVVERFREAFTAKQPHRCHECGRRWWTTVEIHSGDGRPARPEDFRSGREPVPVNPAELDELDPIRSRR